MFNDASNTLFGAILRDSFVCFLLLEVLLCPKLVLYKVKLLHASEALDWGRGEGVVV